MRTASEAARTALAACAGPAAAELGLVYDAEEDAENEADGEDPPEGQSENEEDAEA